MPSYDPDPFAYLARRAVRRGGGRPSFTPSDLGSSLLALWDAEASSSIKRNDAGLVEAWTDTKSGYTLTQTADAAKPFYAPTAFNFTRPGVMFDGVDDVLEMASTPFPIGSDPVEFWALVDQVAPASDTNIRILFGYGNGTATGRRFGRNVLSSRNQAIAFTNTIAANDATGDFSGRNVARYQVSATGTTVSINGGPATTTAVVPATTALRTRMGSGVSAAPSQFAQFTASLMAVTLPLSDLDASLFMAYLLDRRSTSFSDAAIAAKSGAAYTESNRLRARTAPVLVNGVSTLTYLWEGYGQSNQSAQASTPAKLASQTINGITAGGRMVGNSTHPSSDTTAWVPIGGVGLNPLIGTVTGLTDGTLLDASAQAALLPGNGQQGESSLDNMVTIYDHLRLKYYGLTSSSARFVATICGVPGASIAQLSKGDPANRYVRLTDAATAAKTAAGGTITNLCFYWNQGEADLANTGPVWTAAWNLIRANHHADVTIGICGAPANVPMVPVILGQTCARGIGNPNGLEIADAQLRIAQDESADVYIFANYRGTKTGLHGDVNWNRRAGLVAAHIAHERMTLGRRPFPFAPYEILTNRNQMLVSFLVPTPPLVFDVSYDIIAPDFTVAANMQAFLGVNKGFYPKDALGDLTVTNVEIRNGNCLLITCNRDFNASPALDYGRRTAPLGAGNVFDSTVFDPVIQHIYSAPTGQGVWESVPYYVNQPFPNGYDLCLFTRPATPI